MNTIVVIPTKDRPNTLLHTVRSLGIINRDVNLNISATVISDDSTTDIECVRVAEIANVINREYPELRVIHLISKASNSDLSCKVSSPGIARNSAFRFIKENSIIHDSLLLVDDDISFADCTYQSKKYLSDGVKLLRKIKLKNIGHKNIVGCSYRGRQDLSLLEHLFLYYKKSYCDSGLVASSTRDEILLSAPGGISGAFLFIDSPVQKIPSFLPWYNEDYFWLRRMQLHGWNLECASEKLVHAPPDGLTFSSGKLISEQSGEILWNACKDISGKIGLGEVTKNLIVSIKKLIYDLASLGREIKVISKQDDVKNEILDMVDSAIIHFKNIESELETYDHIDRKMPEILKNMADILEYYLSPF